MTGGLKIRISKGVAISLIIMAVGLTLLIYSIYTGGSDFYLFLIFPVIVSGDIFGALGILVLVIGFIALMINISLGRASVVGLGSLEEILDEDEADIKEVKKRSKVTTGGVVFLGPFPIVWGSDKKVGRGMMFVALIITLVLIVLTLLWVFISFKKG